MRILLVNPPRSPVNLIREHAPPDVKPHVHEKLIGPPLSLISLAGNLKDHDVQILDMKAEQDLDPEGWPGHLASATAAISAFNPGLVGVTFLASEFAYGMEILKLAKEMNPAVVNVAGGIHASLVPADFFSPFVDAVFLTQSKKYFRDAVEALDSGGSLESIPNIALHEGKGLKFTRREDVFSNPEAMPDGVFPDRSLLRRYENAYRHRSDPRLATYLYTSIGCRYRCTFCSIWPQSAGKCHLRSVDNVIAELKTIEQPIVRFADADTFGDRAFASRLFDRIIEESIHKDLIMDSRIDTAAHEPALVEKAALAGLKVVICGIESDDRAELDAFRKESDPALVGKAIDAFHRLGIRVRGNYIVQPHFTEDQFKRMEDFAAAHRIDFAGFTIATPMPGTSYHAKMRRKITIRDLSYYNFMNSVFKTAMPEEAFYRRVASMWMVKRGLDVV